MSTKLLLIVTAVVEAVAGLSLVIAPEASRELLLGAALNRHASDLFERIFGAALLCLAVACWKYRNAPQGRAAFRLIGIMTAYNVTAVALLTIAVVALRMQGPLLWPGIILHTALTGWCLTYFVKRSPG